MGGASPNSGVKPKYQLIFVDCSYDPAGITHCHAVRWDAFGNNTSCADDAAVANGNTCQNDDPGSYPAAVLYGNGERIGATEVLAAFRIPVGSQTFSQLHRVRGGVHVNMRRNQYIVANSNPVAIDERAIQIDGDVVADGNVTTEAASEVIPNRYVGTNGSKQFIQHGSPLLPLSVRNGIVTSAPSGCLCFIEDKARIMAIV